MRNYRIAFFTADWNYELVETTLHGAKRFVDAHDNVTLCVFDCFGKDLGTAKDWSEYAIFDLADLNQFDGLLIMGNQIVLKPVRDAISRRVLEAGIPAVSIDCPVEGATQIGVDNEQCQYEIAAHVIRDHGAKRLAYITGILENGCPEGHQRMNGFLRACRDNGVKAQDIEVIEGTWRTSDGATVAEDWLDAGKPLPDAFVCANDEMALGLMEALGDRGVRIPEQVMVTGFDNVGSAELSSPRLSTVDRNYERLVYQAIQAIIDKVDGRERRAYIPFQHAIIMSESCGCKNTARAQYIRDRYFQQTRFLKSFYMQQDAMAEELLEANDLLELMTIVERNHSMFGCDNVYLCINDYYYENYDKKAWRHGPEAFGEEMILAACKESNCEGDGEHRYARFPTYALLPEAILRRERFLVFYPLHYNTSSIGYIAMNGISQAAKVNLHKSIFNFVEIAVENVRKKGLLRQLNDVLDDLYVRDALTELYNRFGFERFGQKAFDEFMARDGSAQILFIDMDDMKGINDRFGHEVGDMAIRATADILRRACDDRSFLMRYGGDEFLVIASGRETALEQDIQRAVAERRDGGDLPFKLSLSIGIVRADGGDPRTLDECILTADQQMYGVKKRRQG
ncbi:MAG: GGDEF domain-containing protein [Clostridia bacterium]|nr:GGDEF domain-containing protein [Clostridia bacterium]